MSEFNQTSFQGGMNMLVDDTRLSTSQYRIGFNVRNRYDVIDPIHKGKKDYALQTGVIQEITTFGIYQIAFVGGIALYKAYNQSGWTRIDGFSMSPTAPRYWTVTVPLATTNYGRLATANNSLAAINSVNTDASVAANEGNTPGLLVQDNINQPQFIFLSPTSGQPVVRTTRTYADWNAEYDGGTGNLIVDEREYVPVGNTMAFVDGVLYIASKDGNSIYRSVSGRPLDFVINVAMNGSAGGDATTTAYSVGIGGITCLRGMQDGALFVAASNANFLVTKNMTQNAPTLWGEYTFIRKFLFEATCLNDRVIIDSLGDTKFIDLTGVRSFNAILQAQNEGRNTPFTATIAAAVKDITQSVAAAIVYDNYEFYALNTVFGSAIAVYDTINNCWASFDTEQTEGKFIKQFAKIELGVQRLYAITDTNELYELYSSSATYSTAVLTTSSISANMLNANENIRLNNAKNEVKLVTLRVILNRITQDVAMTVTPMVNNRVTPQTDYNKAIKYREPANVWINPLNIPDANTQLSNELFSFPNIAQGWKVALVISWIGGGSLTQYSAELKDETPMNPLLSQS